MRVSEIRVKQIRVNQGLGVNSTNLHILNTIAVGQKCIFVLE